MSLSIEERNQAIRLSRKLAADFDPEYAWGFAENHRDKSWFDDFTTLLEMITDSEFTLAASIWAVVAGAIAYVFFPPDVIPDFIPVIGWLDDVSIIGWAMQSVAGDLDLYREHCLSRQLNDEMLLAS